MRFQIPPQARLQAKNRERRSKVHLSAKNGIAKQRERERSCQQRKQDASCSASQLQQQAAPRLSREQQLLDDGGLGRRTAAVGCPVWRRTGSGSSRCSCARRDREIAVAAGVEGPPAAGEVAGWRRQRGRQQRWSASATPACDKNGEDEGKSGKKMNSSYVIYIYI